MPKIKLVLYSPARVALQKEVALHDELCEAIATAIIETQEDTWEMRVAVIAAYCKIAMDGAYTEHDLEMLYPELLRRLQQKRVGIIIPANNIH